MAPWSTRTPPPAQTSLAMLIRPLQPRASAGVGTRVCVNRVTRDCPVTRSTAHRRKEGRVGRRTECNRQAAQPRPTSRAAGTPAPSSTCGACSTRASCRSSRRTAACRSTPKDLATPSLLNICRWPKERQRARGWRAETLPRAMSKSAGPGRMLAALSESPRRPLTQERPFHWQL